MTLKSLVTGVAAAAVVAGAAAGVTSIASVSPAAAPAVAPVVRDVPLQPASNLQGPLLSTLTALAGPGSFAPSGNKAAYIQGGTGRIEGIGADRAYNNAVKAGKFPLTFAINNIVDNGGSATADVTATAATGGTATQTIVFVTGPSPTGWQIEKGSALSLLSSVG